MRRKAGRSTEGFPIRTHGLAGTGESMAYSDLTTMQLESIKRELEAEHAAFAAEDRKSVV